MKALPLKANDPCPLSTSTRYMVSSISSDILERAQSRTASTLDHIRVEETSCPLSSFLPGLDVAEVVESNPY
jgi:hypothetical protein